MGDAEVAVTAYPTNNNTTEIDVLIESKQPAVCITDGTPKTEINGVSPVNGSKSASPAESSEHSSLDAFNYEVTNELAPATSYSVTNASEPVNIRLSDREYCNDQPISVPYLLNSTSQKIPNVTALAVKRDNVWVKWSYKDYQDDVLLVARAFIKLGLEPGNGVGILGFNSPEWLISNLAAIYAGGVSVGIYTTNTPEACAFVAEDSHTNIMIVENHQQLQKILEVRDSLPDLKAIIVYSGEVAVKEPNIYSWEDMKKIGSEVPMSTVHQRLQLIRPNKCCLLIYTSGTTGNPKGVMISHDNLTWTASMVKQTLPVDFATDCLVSYLPLSHVAAQLLDIYLSISVGGSVYFAQPDALKGSLVHTLREIRPTVFLGVPRVWEKIVENIKSIGRESTGIKKRIATWAKTVGLKGSYSRMNGFQSQGKFQRRTAKPLLWPVANALVFKKVKNTLGLDRCKLCFSAAAPIMKETLDFMMSLNIPLLEIYGMSECSGPHTAATPKKFKISTVGTEICGVQTQLLSMDADGNGEVCMHGRHVFMGYLNAPEKTKDALDEDGWLHSGDIGKKEKDFLYITGRIKELIITAGGENVAPCPIEEAVKEELPIISQCMLVGDKRKFLAMLITLKTEVDDDTQVPKDELTKPAKDWCRSVDSQANNLTEIVQQKDGKVMRAIESGIERANKKAVSRATKVQKWSILPRDFSIPGGELGPTMKLRRPIIHKMYAATIEAFYS